MGRIRLKTSGRRDDSREEGKGQKGREERGRIEGGSRYSRGGFRVRGRGGGRDRGEEGTLKY